MPARSAVVLLCLLLLSGCSGTAVNRVRFGTGPAEIDIEDQALQADCEIVRGEADHTDDGGIASGRVLLRCLQDDPLALEYRVTWWDEHEHRLPTSRAWIPLEAPGRKETVVSVRPPAEQGHRARRGTFELRYHSPPE